MNFIISAFAALGGGLGTLFSWVVNWFISWRANKAAASQQMGADLESHASDGAISVADATSIEAQDADLDAQAAAIDSAADQVAVEQPATPTKGQP